MRRPPDPTTTRTTRIVGLHGPSVGGQASYPVTGSERSASRGGPFRLGPSAPRDEGVESRAPDRATAEIAQNDSSRQTDRGVAVDRPHDPIDIGRLDGRHLAQGQARELAELQARVQRLVERRQIGLQGRSAASERRPAGGRCPGRFVTFGRTRPRRQPGEWTVFQRAQRGVAGPQQRSWCRCGP